MEHLKWPHKSSHSNPQGNCIEVADLGSSRAVRDSKNPNGAVLFVTAAEWSAFCDAVKAGTLD